MHSWDDLKGLVWRRSVPEGLTSAVGVGREGTRTSDEVRP
jgi:hypothetical protein